jgi:hypothetical protein
MATMHNTTIIQKMRFLVADFDFTPRIGEKIPIAAPSFDDKTQRIVSKLQQSGQPARKNVPG